MNRAEPTTPARWTAERERSRLWVITAMRWIAVHLGRRFSRAVLHPITLYFLLADRSAMRHSRRYLARALGRTPTVRDRYRHLHSFASTLLDRVYFLQGSNELFELRSDGGEAMHALMDKTPGLLLVGAHFGSFEALRSYGHDKDFRVAMVMYEENARLINATLRAIAPEASLHTIGLGRIDAMLSLRRWLDQGGLGGMLADRTLPGQSERGRIFDVPFLGAPAPFSDGPFRLAALLRRPVVFMAGIYLGANRYELRFRELADFSERSAAATLDERIEAAVRRYVAMLEALCREAPYNWFNFFDFWGDDAGSFEGRPVGAIDDA